jgi:hypothetical protein
MMNIMPYGQKKPSCLVRSVAFRPCLMTSLALSCFLILLPLIICEPIVLRQWNSVVLLGTSKLSAVVANDLSGLIGTTEVVSNETNRIVTGDLPPAIS